MKSSFTIPFGDVQLRAGVENDEAMLFTLFSACREDLLSAISNLDAAQQESFLRLQFMAQREQYRRTSADACQSMIVYQGEVIGQILVERGDDLCLVDLGLLPEYRNRGIGGALLQALLDEAGESGKCVILHVLQHNPAARLYERLGFQYQGNEGLYRRMQWDPSSDRSETNQ